MMKKLALAASILAISAVSASAADMAPRYTKAPPPVVVAMYDWSGFYVGLDGGGGWARKCWDLTNNGGVLVNPAVSAGCHSARGGMFGAQAGYRWQMASWVFGLEAKGDWANLRGSNPVLLAPLFSNQTKVNAIGLFTAQAGYAWDKFMVYGKAGAAVAADRYYGIVTATGAAFDTASETRVGAYVAIGGEYGITPNVSIAAEYGHGFMGTKSINLTSTGLFIPAGVFSRTDNIRQDLDLFTVRLNYRFGGPVVAKY